MLRRDPFHVFLQDLPPEEFRRELYMFSDSMMLGQGGAGGADYQIPYAVMLDGSADYFTRTPGSDGDLKKWTLFSWVKMCSTGTITLFGAGSGNDYYYVRFTSSVVNIRLRVAGVDYEFNFTPLFRDLTAWAMLGVHHDHSQATAANRCYITWNGTRYDYTSGTMIAQSVNSSSWNKAGVVHYLGYAPAAASYWNSYITHPILVDGAALDPFYFGEIDTTTGSWKPKAPSGITYGTNGFWLDFADTADLGNDVSGNNNDWTLNSLSSADAVTDTPTNNFATWNALRPSTSALSNGNRTAAGTASGTIPVSISDKWYWEITANAVGVTAGLENTSGTTYTTSVGNGTTMSFRYTHSTATLESSTDGVSWSTVSSSVSGIAFPYATGGSNTVNFGATTFARTPPTGFKALCTANLPVPSIKDPGKHMGVLTWTGNGSTQAISGLDFQSDFIWVKKRNAVRSHGLLNVVQGWRNELISNSTAAENVYASDVVTPNAAGFTINGAYSSYNDPGDTYVAWCWKAGGAPVANTSGSIASQVSANTTAGFSIVTYTGNGLSGATIGHGLGSTPKLVIIKRRNAASDWAVRHGSLNTASVVLLNSTAAKFEDAAYWNNTSPSSTVVSLGNNAAVNASGETYVAYCWAEVPGFSKFGFYTGNGSADGPFVHCGFRPRWLLIKRAESSGYNWYMMDTERVAFNVCSKDLFANLTNAEGSYAAPQMDITATGFKPRSTGPGSALIEINASGGTYIFAAFAEYPFGGSNITPGKAR